MHRKNRFILIIFPIIFCIVSVLLIGFNTPLVHAASAAPGNGLALTPPMGWNSWNKFGCNINEALIKQEADTIVSSGMKAAGYQYVNIDDCWASSRDSAGNIVADPNAFPDGIKALATYVHNDGLKLGIYTDAGTSTCAGRPGSYGHEQQDANTYASWGIDYLKEDWCNTSGLDPQTQYTVMRNALNATGRAIVFSLCDQGTNSPWIWGPGIGNLWRTTDDIQDNWARMLVVLDSSSQHPSAAGPGSWNDPDMLEVGNGGMTTTEDQAHFSLWAEMAAPLISGNDLATMSSTTQTILTNSEVIAVDQDAAGVQGTVVSDNGAGLQVWSKKLSVGGSRAVVLFNRSASAANITANWSDLGLAGGSASVRDLLAHTDLGAFNNNYTATVPAHGVVMLKITGAEGNNVACNGLTGYYTFVNRNSGLLLDVSGASTNDSAPVIQYANNGQANQQWSFVDAGNGYCRIVNRNSGKLLNISGATMTQGTQLIQYSDDGNSNSQWSLTAVGGGYYNIVSRYDGQDIDVQGASTASNTPIIQWPNNGGANQQWQLVAV
jgi:alpha-galactosidase